MQSQLPHRDGHPVKTLPYGLVSLVLVQRVRNLPKTADQYRSVFTSDPSLARWRRGADGR